MSAITIWGTFTCNTPTLVSSTDLYSIFIAFILGTYGDEIAQPVQTGPCVTTGTQHKYWHALQRVQFK
jgi:hypothetical protein